MDPFVPHAGESPQVTVFQPSPVPYGGRTAVPSLRGVTGGLGGMVPPPPPPALGASGSFDALNGGELDGGGGRAFLGTGRSPALLDKDLGNAQNGRHCSPGGEAPSEAPPRLAGGVPGGGHRERRRRRGEAATPGARRDREQRERRKRTRGHRHRLNRPRSMGEGLWRRAVAGALGELGRPDLARGLLSCGRSVLVWSCGACGEPAASMERRIHCGLRACPDCQRWQTRERVERMVSAALRVPDFVHAQAPAVRAKLGAELAEAERLVAHHAETARRAAERLAGRRDPSGRMALEDRATLERAQVAGEKAEHRRRRARRWLSNARNLGSWSWKMVSVSPPWDPAAEADVSVGGLQRRLADLLARVDALVAEVLSVAGLAAITVRVEFSALGHVHAHVLYFGPWVVPSFAAEVAGCIVDVRAATTNRKRARPTDFVADTLRDAVKECIKYAVKLGSPLSAEWLAGATRRVVHPELLARWLIATYNRNLIRHRGVMSDALAAVDACEAKRTPAPVGLPGCCPRCKREIPADQEPRRMGLREFIAEHGVAAFRRVRTVRIQR